MSPSERSLRAIIGAARAAVRRDAVLAATLAVGALIPAALVAVWLLSLSTHIAHHVPLIIDIAVAIAAIGLALVAHRRWVHGVTDRAVARSAESQLGFQEGELQGVLEMSDAAPAGTSSALLRRAQNDLAHRLGSNAPSEIAGPLGRETRSRRVRVMAAAASLGGVVLLLALAAPERSRASWSPLLRPVATIAATALPALDVQPGNVTVPRGTALDIAVAARERDAVMLYWREQGDVLHEQTLPVLDSRATGRVSNVDAPVRYWVRAPDGAVSDTFTITPLDPLLVSGLSIEVVYPGYLQRAPEHFDKDVPPLELPQGTQLRIHGRSTRALRSASLLRAAERIPLNVQGSSFDVSWTPRVSGTYAWQLSGRETIDVAATPAPLDLTIVADAPPQLEVTYPGADTLLPGDMKQLLVADASDDHAVIAATVVSWRTSSTGGREQPIEQALQLEGDVDRKLVRGVLDATSRHLLPGDTLSYFVRVVDNSPARQATESRTFTLRVPGMEEMRERAQAQADDLVKDANAITRAMEQLEARTRELQRKSVSGTARSGAQGAGGAPGENEQRQLSSEQAAQAKEVLQRQEALAGELDKMRDRIEAMERAAQQAGLNDPEMQKRMEELRQLYDQLLTPEMKKQMQQLREALDKLDPEQVQKALEELAKQQAEL
ncbi:MAG TPA: hypothetical protein VF021_04315, partial [Longimicrobiales bacterium]